MLESEVSQDLGTVTHSGKEATGRPATGGASSNNATGTPDCQRATSNGSPAGGHARPPAADNHVLDDLDELNFLQELDQQQKKEFQIKNLDELEDLLLLQEDELVHQKSPSSNSDFLK